MGYRIRIWKTKGSNLNLWDNWSFSIWAGKVKYASGSGYMSKSSALRSARREKKRLERDVGIPGPREFRS